MPNKSHAAAFILAPLLLAARAPVEDPRPLPNGWAYGEAGNNCMAIRDLTRGGPRLMMRLTKWDDHSDSLIFWQPGLPRLDDEDEKAADAGFGLKVLIDGREIPRAMDNRMIEDFADNPGPSYRLGVAQAPFIAALAKGARLQIRRGRRTLATFPIAGSTAMATEFATCVEKDPSF